MFTFGHRNSRTMRKLKNMVEQPRVRETPEEKTESLIKCKYDYYEKEGNNLFFLMVRTRSNCSKKKTEVGHLRKKNCRSKPSGMVK